MALSKERLEIEAMVKKAQNNRCSLCKIGEKSLELTGLAMGEPTNGGTDLFKDSIDLDIEASLEKLRANSWTEFGEINLDHIPNLTQLMPTDNFLEESDDLQLLKFNALNFS